MNVVEREISEHISEAGDDLCALRDLESVLEPFKGHPVVATAIREISSRILALELKGE